MSIETNEDRYIELVRKFPLRPLRSEEELDRAIAMVNTLIGRDLDRDEYDYREVLSDIIADYEDTTDPLPQMSGVETLRALLAANNLNESDLAARPASRSPTLSEILDEKRSFSPKVHKILAKRFAVDAGFFV